MGELSEEKLVRHLAERKLVGLAAKARYPDAKKSIEDRLLHIEDELLQQIYIEKEILGKVAALTGMQGNVTVMRDGAPVSATDGMRVKQKDEITVPRDARVTVVYDHGCDEVWDGFKVAGIDVESCPPIAAVVPQNCTPPVLGNATPADLLVTGLAFGGGVVVITNGGDDRPVSP